MKNSKDTNIIIQRQVRERIKQNILVHTHIVSLFGRQNQREKKEQ